MIPLLLIGAVVLIVLALLAGGTREAGVVALVLLLALVIYLVLTPPSARASHDPGDIAPTSACRTGSPVQMHCLHAWTRGQHGVPNPTYRTQALYLAAQAKLMLMVKCGEFSHTPCGEPFRCPEGVFACGENIACGYLTQRAAFAGWMHSAAHRTNILNPYWKLYGSAYSAAGIPACPRVWVTIFAT